MQTRVNISTILDVLYDTYPFRSPFQRTTSVHVAQNRRSTLEHTRSAHFDRQTASCIERGGFLGLAAATAEDLLRMELAFSSASTFPFLRAARGVALRSQAPALSRTFRRALVASASAPVSSSSTSVQASVRWRVRSIHEAAERIIGSTLCVKGWVRTVRDQKQFAFVDVNDGSSIAGLQIVVDAGTDAYGVISQLTTGCSVSAVGEIIASPGKGQAVEMKATDLQLVGGCDSTYPLQKKRHTLEFLRGIAHLRPRTNAIGAVSRVRSALALATHEFFAKNGFVYLHSPIITASDCEGAGEMFRVTTAIPADAKIADIPTEKGAQENMVDFTQDFFDRPAFLTVSGQLSAEAYACALSDVYTFGPTFRAENSNTSRHLAEFWMIEPEMAFASLADAMGNAEAYIKHLLSVVMNKCSPDLEFFNKFVEKGLIDKLTVVRDKPFARITYTEAVELLENANKPNKKGKRRFQFPVEWGCDLQSEHERYLAEEHFQCPVFVYNYPSEIKAFYMRDNGTDSGKTVEAMDLLVPGIGELIGGSAREDRINVLEQKIRDNNLEPEAYWWYMDLRRYGSVPHAGYGLGFERLVQFVTGMDNIRDVIPFPRYPGSAEF